MVNQQHMELFQIFYQLKLELMFSLMDIYQMKMLDLERKKFSMDVSSSSTDIFQEGTDIVNYPKLEKKFDSFSVTIEPGVVRKGEVLGIMGANALGKTTMMKMIAGVQKPDVGSIDKKIKIAYKPQYLAK